MRREEYNALSSRIIGCAVEVHKNLGPGLMESVYDYCLSEELTKQGLYVERQKPLPVIYKGKPLNKTFIVDHLVEDVIILELKSVEATITLHEAQLLTYLRLAEIKLGLLFNFNVVSLVQEGIRRKINGIL